MTLQPIQGFTSLKTLHCYTGSMRHIYHFNGHDTSEDMLLGLGGGVGLIYWHQKGGLPFMGGRATPKPSMEEIAGERTGVAIQSFTTSSPKKARATLLEQLEAGQPVMLQVDMGYLPYFDFDGQEYHFGGHIVTACGYDPDCDQVLIADRDGLHPAAMTDLEKARASDTRPFTPRRRWYRFDFTNARGPWPEEVRKAILEQAAGMLEPPISNFGVTGIRKAAERIPKWPKTLLPEQIRPALFNLHIFINAMGGTGGGIFRYMFGRFLAEAAEIVKEPALLESAETFQQIGDAWEVFGDWLLATSESPDPVARLAECCGPLLDIANKEEFAWRRLREIVTEE